MNPSEPSLIHQTTLVFDPELQIFNDHFPSRPIVPAYLQLACIRDEASRWLQRCASRVKVKGMKYKRHIAPGREVVMSLERGSSDDAISVTLTLDGEVVTTGQLSFV